MLNFESLENIEHFKRKKQYKTYRCMHLKNIKTEERKIFHDIVAVFVNPKLEKKNVFDVMEQLGYFVLDQKEEAQIRYYLIVKDEEENMLHLFEIC